MKPRHLKIKGFLSYQDPVEIDFTEFDLACITGENGAGKSSILDAITWVLFGKARQTNESLINLQSDEAIVNFSFEYSGESYKVRRSNKRGKPARLTLKTPEIDLTERTTRDTQNKIEQILKIDYETFIHAVFFLQGESDQFVSAPSGKRKQVLFDILGLDAWEEFRLSAAAEIKTIEKSMEQAQGSVQVLEEGIGKGPEIARDLELAEDELPALAGALKSAQAALNIAETKKEEWKAWENELAELAAKQHKANNKSQELIERIQSLEGQQQRNSEIVSRKEQIIKDYGRWGEVDYMLDDLQQRRIEHAKLINDLAVLESSLLDIEHNLKQFPNMEKDISEWEKQLEEAKGIEAQIKEIETNRIKWAAEAEGLSIQDKELLEQITGLEGHQSCPLCEQKLKNPAELISKLRVERDGVQEKLLLLKDGQARSSNELNILKAALILPEVLKEKIATTKQSIESGISAHNEFDHDRIEEIKAEVVSLNYSEEKMTELKNESALLKDASRDHGLLEGAEKVGDSLDTQLKDLEQDLFDSDATVKEYQALIDAKENEVAEDHCPGDAEMKEFVFARDQADKQLQEKNQQVGELNQVLKSIADQKEQLKEIRDKGKENTDLHQKYSTLQEAFSKKGVPALLVEQSLPQIESKANQLLNRLSDGKMAVHFITQKAYSDSTREDMKETLDIEIQDSAGIRDYEMYSGGESFRINFAIRMALSNVLANRAGAKLRTLVIDEGFGSQDAGGRDRLINAINMVKEEYDKVLVITHIPEVIESFPVQLRVEKTSTGSQVRII